MCRLRSVCLSLSAPELSIGGFSEWIVPTVALETAKLPRLCAKKGTLRTLGVWAPCKYDAPRPACAACTWRAVLVLRDAGGCGVA